MKNHLLILIIPFAAFCQSSYELYPAKECEALKADYTAQINEIQNLNGSQRVNLLGLNQQLVGIRSYGESVTNIQSQAQATDFDATSLSAAYATLAYANSSLETISTLLDNNSTNNYRLGQLLTSVQNLDCGKCGSDSTNCCDFTEIEQQLDDLIYLLDIHATITEEIRDNLNDIKPILEVGMGSITNLLSNLLFLSNPTSRLGQTIAAHSSNPYQNIRYSNGVFSYNGNLNGYNLTGIATGTKFSIFDYLKTLVINSQTFAVIANQLNWIHNDFNNFTNEVGFIHRDQTNYFSFFRGEIGVQGVLSDWQSEQVSGSYHDFLTNHYLTVVRGGPLSGNQLTKTNWFSRVETLLAALVFTDSLETNTVDTSAGKSERQQLASSYGTANQAAASFSDDFKTTSQSIVTLYQNYFTTFENASMPSHVVLVRLSNADPSEQVEISFQSDSLGILVESCRVVTTLCWSSVGIFLLYKFLVWSARCVTVACQFIYRAISSVFRS